jgi:NHLM bacteriocin system ABC transporter ATP-binding protein
VQTRQDLQTDPVPLQGHITLVLDGPPADYLVEAGQATVFWARVEGGVPVGPRHYVLTAQRGEGLFGAADLTEAGTQRFVVVGSQDCRLRPLPAPGTDLLEKWIEKLTGLLVADPPPAGTTSPGAARYVLLMPGQVFRPPHRAVWWVCVEQGAAAFMGVPDLAVGAGSPPLPLGGDAWLRAEKETRLILLRSPDLAGDEDLRQGIARLNALLFGFFRLKEEREARAEAERLRQRRQQEALETDEAVGELVRVLHPRPAPAPPESELMAALAAVGGALEVTFREPARSEDLSRVPDLLEAVARASRLRLRHVQLRGAWWRSDCGPLLGYLRQDEEERPVALLRGRGGAYELVDPRAGGRRPLTAETLARLAPRAVMFYRPFPDRALSLLDLPVFGYRPYVREWVLAVLVMLGSTLLGMLVPQATRWIIDYAIPDADHSFLGELALVLVAVNCGQAAFVLAEGVFSLRAVTGATAALQAATWDRLLRLPPRFFRQFASGDLLNRSLMITEVSHVLGGTTVRTLLSGSLALLNLALLVYYSPRLAWVGVGVALVSSAVTAGLGYAIRRRALEARQLNGKLFGFVVQLINGIAKLRVAGAERRAYNRWARRYAEQLRLTASVKLLEDAGRLFNYALPTLSAMLIFYLAAAALRAPADGAGALTLGAFLAFSTAYGFFVAGVTSVSHTLVDITDSLSMQRLITPILEANPESDAVRADPGRLKGEVALEKVVFRYQANGPLILNEVSLRAHAGEFIALVGPSGSGKSTVLRLLMGFERPASGSVLYDGQNLDGLDLTAVRRQLGVVLQSARLQGGSVFENIACGNLVGLEEAWEAARDAGLAEDLEQMPMKMHTVLSEGGGNLSGGQRQRLMIARALVMNPKVLLFDEATSALDNATQAVVSRSLQRRQVTRLVIAHRLSTIQHADRIYVLENGRVVQVGTFAELAAREGLFRRMMARQDT